MRPLQRLAEINGKSGAAKLALDIEKDMTVVLSVETPYFDNVEAAAQAFVALEQSVERTRPLLADSLAE